MRRKPLSLARLGPFGPRRNPSRDPIDTLQAAIRRAHQLAAHLKRVTRNHTKVEADPDVMQICAHCLATQIDAVRARLEFRDHIHSPLEAQKAVLQTAWNYARSLEAEAKRLRRDPEWKAWVALSPRTQKTWLVGEDAAQGAEDDANTASANFHNERYSSAVMNLHDVVDVAANILGRYGYASIESALSRQTWLVHLLPGTE